MSQIANEIECADDPEYQQWLEEAAKKCTCCPVCWEVPCDGCLAGGICDNICNCEEQGFKYC